MIIRFAERSDTAYLAALDAHISVDELENIVKLKRVYIAEESGNLVGWLRYGLFWDNTPFMNMLYILEEYRGIGLGRRLVQRWEMDMKRLGYSIVMTSSPSDEYSQHFYVKLGYKATGGFMPKGEPFELIFIKNVN